MGDWLTLCEVNFQRKEERIRAQVVCEAGEDGSWAQAEALRPGRPWGVKNWEVQVSVYFCNVQIGSCPWLCDSLQKLNFKGPMIPAPSC